MDKVVAYMICEQSTPTKGKILTDTNECVKVYTELQDASEFNRNGRKYPIEILKAGLSHERITELITKKSWFGEAGHPLNPTVDRQMTIEESNRSHRILSIDIKGSKVYGVVKTTPTVRGREMRDLILDEDAMQSAYSLRALGPIKQTSEGKIVGSPLVVVTYDWVCYPSHRNSYQQNIISEATSFNNSINESFAIPILEASAIDFIKHESKNYKLVSQFLEEFETSNILLGESCKNIILENKNNNDRLVVGVESFIGNEINSYFNKFK